MADRKFQNKVSRKGKNKKNIALIVSVVLVLTLAVGGTLAYMVQRTGKVQNSFGQAYVTSQVNDGDDTVSVTNTGNVEAYIRAAVVVNWVDSEGKVYAIPPAGVTYSVAVAASQNYADSNPWYQDPTTGFYYCKSVIAPSGTTPDLVTAMTTEGALPQGYELLVEVVAEAIQASGDTDDGGVPAFQDAWEITIYGSN